MTKIRRFNRILLGILMIILGLLLPIGPAERNLPLIAVILSVTMIVRGLGTLIYYFRMARHMVGGRMSLYLGIIMLDAGLFTFSLINNSLFYILIYLAAVHLFTGAVDIMRSMEAHKVGAPRWRGQLLYGITNAGLAIALVAGGVFFNSARLAVYIYAAGLVYTGIIRVATAFKRSAIVYIQ